METLDRMMAYLENSPSPYHAVRCAAALLEGAGFLRLEEAAIWRLEPQRG